MVRRNSDSIFPVVRGISVRDILAHEELRPVVNLAAGEAGLDRQITHPRIQKSGLVLAGHTVGFVPTRVQILGETEISYLESLDPETRAQRANGLFALNCSLVIVTRGVEPLPELLAAARRTGSPLVVTSPRSSRTIAIVHNVLDRLLAPTAAVHAVLVEIHGIGTLLTGPSGIGKSECALFLLERGHHRLVADDQVILTRLPNGRIMGRPPPLLRHHLEVRGIGILNVRDLFGATAVRDEAVVELVCELCPWRDDEDYERLGLDDLTHDLFGTKIPMLRIPVRPGRNMAVILEVAARNQLLKRAGHHAAKNFAREMAEKLGLADPPSPPEGEGEGDA